MRVCALCLLSRVQTHYARAHRAGAAGCSVALVRALHGGALRVGPALRAHCVWVLPCGRTACGSCRAGALRVGPALRAHCVWVLPCGRTAWAHLVELVVGLVLERVAGWGVLGAARGCGSDKQAKGRVQREGPTTTDTRWWFLDAAGGCGGMNRLRGACTDAHHAQS